MTANDNFAGTSLLVHDVDGDGRLDIVIGTTDGYENFRLSPSGATFVAMWQRQRES